MNETPAAASEPVRVTCKHCDQPIRMFFGTWIHDRAGQNTPFAMAPFCDDDLAKAEPFEGDR